MKKLLTHTVFEEQVARVPQKIAIEEAGCHVSYRQLNRRANQLSRQFQSAGLQANGLVGVVLSGSTNLVASLLGCFKAGGVYVPINLLFPAKRLRQIFTQTCPQVLVTDQQHVAQLSALLSDENLSIPLLVLPDESDEWHRWEQEPTNEWDNNLSLPLRGEDSSYIFYSSGSSGEAKAILGKHESLSHFMHWQIKEFAVDESIRVSQLIEVTFDASLRDIFLPLMTGGTLCIPSAGTNTNTAALVEWLESSRVILMHCVPSLFRLLNKELQQGARRQRLPDLRFVLLSGEALYGKDVADWREYTGGHAEVVNLYGATETTLIKFFYRVGELPANKAQVLPVGKPIDNTLVAVIKDNRKCRIGEIGEVYIKTHFTSKGYINNPVLQQAAFVPNPLSDDPTDIVYRTGDMGRLLSDGNLEILGRLDEQVKVNGVLVELEEVRHAVLEVKGVREVVVLPLKDDNHQIFLVCYYTGSLSEESSIREHLEQTVGSHALPSHFVKLESFPLNLNGKINKKELPRPHLMLVSNYVAAATPLEKRLESIWQEVLGLERIGRKASFFRIGGTSLKAIQIISRIYKEFQVLITIKDIFAQPTIEQLATFISGGVRKHYEEIKPVSLQAYYPVSHAQNRLWILHQFDQEQTAYNISESYRLEGHLQPLALQQSLQAIVARHESLRTTFFMHQGELCQKIWPSENFDYCLEQIDLRDSQQAEEQLEQLARQETNWVFDMEKGPLLRTKLVQLEQDKYVFIFTIHHIISDGWSMQLLMREIALLYNTFCRGEQNPLVPLTLQYKDYAAWQHQQLTGPMHHYHQEYWHKQFAGELPQLNLPTDFPRPERQTFRGNQIHFTIEPGMVDDVRRISQENEVTLFMLLLTLVKGLLFKITGQTDIIIGFPVAGREDKVLEDQVGLYLNTLAIRTEFHPSESFKDVLLKIKSSVLGAYQHQVYPFDMLIEELDLDRDLSRSALFDVTVQLQNIDHKANHTIIMQDMEISGFQNAVEGSKSDLIFYFHDQTDTISVRIEYNTDLFREETVLAIKHTLLQLTSLVVKTTDVSFKELKRELSERTTSGFTSLNQVGYSSFSG